MARPGRYEATEMLRRAIVQYRQDPTMVEGENAFISTELRTSSAGFAKSRTLEPVRNFMEQHGSHLRSTDYSMHSEDKYVVSREKLKDFAVNTHIRLESGRVVRPPR
ncbi:hypothetical protein TOPH_05401 [Tolypocladium ophioglossoides CBS 100239]|uniref:Uncharacterized protein n=1 Tax=Tolypocladium ophioglossoides (strain CBS 100239) TaxID=1163406 RepID=A0A0L0N8B4_TOLOC|nr:hypothetical protein TOPH_05401 [Tolypocladium ophioglossoides CBS 100239]